MLHGFNDDSTKFLSSLWDIYKTNQIEKLREMRSSLLVNPAWKKLLTFVDKFVEQYPKKSVNVVNGFLDIQKAVLEYPGTNEQKEFTKQALFRCLIWARRKHYIDKEALSIEGQVNSSYKNRSLKFLQQEIRLICHWSYAFLRDNTRKLESLSMADKVFNKRPTALMLKGLEYHFSDSISLPYPSIIGSDTPIKHFTGIAKLRYDRSYVACYFLYHFQDLLEGGSVDETISLIEEELLPAIRDVLEMTTELNGNKDFSNLFEAFEEAIEVSEDPGLIRTTNRTNGDTKLWTIDISNLG